VVYNAKAILQHALLHLYSCLAELVDWHYGQFVIMDSALLQEFPTICAHVYDPFGRFR
jgi:hypothetical protein